MNFFKGINVLFVKDQVRLNYWMDFHALSQLMRNVSFQKIFIPLPWLMGVSRTFLWEFQFWFILPFKHFAIEVFP